MCEKEGGILIKYVAVRHKPKDTKVWWFFVPPELEDKVNLGAEVLCFTKYGKATGKVVSIMEGISYNEAAKIIGNHFPLKSLVATSTMFPINEIKIPSKYSSSLPSSRKIEQRITEFYKKGEFNTPVIIAPSGELRDGYTAYLVAKMFGHKELCCTCVAD